MSLLLLVLNFHRFFPGREDLEVVSPEIEKTVEEKPKYRGTLYIVIDDVGNSTKDLQPFLALDIPMTFSVMPACPYTRETTELLHQAGKEVILHQPMEPENGQNPGAGAIYSGMKREEVREILKENLADIPHAGGMNNHMGSKITADREIMTWILEFVKENDIFYLDSYTTGNSVVEEVADSVKVTYGRRNSMFLDNERNRESILEALRAGLETAEKKGHAVMIGHIMSTELAEVLMEMYPEFIEEGYSFEELSNLFMENMKDVDPRY